MTLINQSESNLGNVKSIVRGTLILNRCSYHKILPSPGQLLSEGCSSKPGPAVLVAAAVDIHCAGKNHALTNDFLVLK